MSDATAIDLKFLENRWNAGDVEKLTANPLDLLRYRSNRLGDDLRITNFGGGNTSSKFDLADPFTGQPTRVMAVKGSGGDLRSIGSSGFAVLYLDKLEQLIERYRGEAHEDEMVEFYPLCAFGQNRVAASIDTPLHAFLPFPHVDHLHPDWAIALAASANGDAKLREFNATYDRRIVWVPWQRPGFELALMLRRAVAAQPGCDGIILGGHGLFTWGQTQRECYQSSIRTIDEMGQFVDAHARKVSAVFGGAAVTGPASADVAARVLPHLRGAVSTNRRTIAHWDHSPDATSFANAAWAEELCRLGTSCPDHFLRTRISPMFVPWDPAAGDVAALERSIDARIATYREDYAAYYQAHALFDSPKLRDTNPSVVVIPGLGIFGFAKDKREARITTEFFVNAIHVMAGATALDTPRDRATPFPQAKKAEQSRDFTSFHNYVALPRSEAFRIEYWALEEAKLQRMPPEKDLSRRIALVVGAGSGIGREAAILLAKRGAHVIVADRDDAAGKDASAAVAAVSSAESVRALTVDVSSRASIHDAVRSAVLAFGGLDIVVNTAAVYPTPPPGTPIEDVWASTLRVNVTSNHVLAEEVGAVLTAQKLPASIVLTSSANAVVPKSGSEPYDVSKAAVNHLIRELAMRLGPSGVRVNGIAPATVVAGSAMFPRDRVIGSLQKYAIPFEDSDSTEVLRGKLAGFYAQRTILNRPILPADCASAIVWLATDDSAKTTGHVIPVDGGLAEAFLR